MSIQDDLNAKIGELNSAIAAEKDQVAQAISSLDALRAQVQDLQNQLAQGQDISAQLAALNDSIAGVQNIFTPQETA